MLHWALFFFIVSLISAFYGHERLSAITNSLSLYLFVAFFGLLLFSFVLDHLLRSRRRR